MRPRTNNGLKMGKKEVSIAIIFVFVFLFLRFSYHRTLRPLMSAESQEASVSEGYISILDQSIYSKSYKPNGRAKATVLLLHGQAFSSENWKEINTLQSLQSAEIFAFAIDLPGYGKSHEAKATDHALFLKEVIDSLDGDVKVVVSPSMSGKFTMPYLNRYGGEITGFVPVAPVSVKSLSPSKEVSEKLSVLAIAGEKDTDGVANLSVFQNTFLHCDQLVIKNAAHPAYLDEPELFNSRLINFALSLSST